MGRPKGSKVIDGKLVVPEKELVAEIAEQEQKPVGLGKPSEPELAAPFRESVKEWAEPSQSRLPINAKFAHVGEDLEIILWRGNFTKTVKIPAMFMISNSKGRVAEFVAQEILKGINTL